MKSTRRVGAIGGAANEAGSLFRAEVAAWFVVHGFLERSVDGIGSDAADGYPTAVYLEADSALDDIEVELSGGRTAVVQAKRSLRFGGTGSEFGSVVGQWRAAAESATADGPLVLAVGEASAPIRDLASALDKKRLDRRSRLSTREDLALTRLHALLGQTPQDIVDRLVGQAAILELDFVRRPSITRAAAEEWLNSRVVTGNGGKRAYRSLTQQAWRHASRRTGDVIEGWLRRLRDDVELQVDRTASLAARAAARWEAIDRYREHVQQFGSRIDLRPLGVALAPLRVESAAAELIVAVDPDPDQSADDSRLERRLSLAVRRRGRVILTGLPGLGKSTALIQLAAHWASQQAWPLPLIVPLKRLRGLHGVAFDEGVIEEATALADIGDRELVREEVRSRLADGTAFLILDGLDECRTQRLEVCRELNRFLATVHRDNEVILSTRDATYSDAATLGYPRLRLRLPQQLDRMLEQCAVALAESAGVSRSRKSSWVAKRMDWVRSAREAERAVRETPLLQMLLVVLAAQHDEDDLPKSQAEILSLIIDDAASRLEIRQRESGSRIGPLEGTSALTALRIGYGVISDGWLRRGPQDWTKLSAELQRAAQAGWGLPDLHAQAVAEDTLHFWDEAGVFVATGTHRVVEPRVRLFGEIGAARFLVTQAPAVRRDRLAALVEDADSRQVVLLAAGLSPDVADELATIVDSRDGVLLAAEAIRRGAEPSTQSRLRVTRMLADLIPRDDDRYRLAQALVALEVPREHAPEMLSVLNSNFERGDAAVLGAFGAAHWLDLDAGEADSALLAVLDTPEPERRGWGDSSYGDAILLAARRLLPLHPSLAVRIAELAPQVSVSANDSLGELLRANGHRRLHSDLMKRRWQAMSPGIQDFMNAGVEFDKGWTDLLQRLGDWGPAALSEPQRRRLDEFCELIQTMRIPQSPLGYFPHAMRKRAGLFELLEYVADLGRFDRHVIAAQALEVLSWDNPAEAIAFAGDLLEVRNLDNWEGLDNPAEVALRLLDLYPRSMFFAEVTADALIKCPDRQTIEAALANRMPTLSREGRRFTGFVLGMMSESDAAYIDSLRNSLDPVMREVGGIWAAHCILNHEISAETLRPFVLDADARVRTQTLEPFTRSTKRVALTQEQRTELAVLVSEASVKPAKDWVCWRCDLTYPATQTSCSECHVVGNQVERFVTDLIDYLSDPNPES